MLNVSVRMYVRLRFQLQRFNFEQIANFLLSPPHKKNKKPPTPTPIPPPRLRFP